MSKLSLLTIKCPVCHKGDVAYPFDDEGCGYCRHCGASLEQIKRHFEIEAKLGFYGIVFFGVLIIGILIFKSIVH